MGSLESFAGGLHRNDSFEMIFRDFGCLNESQESPIFECEIKKVRPSNVKFPEVTLESLLGLILFCVLKTDLLTAMGTNRHLSERLKSFTQLSIGKGEILGIQNIFVSKKRLWEIQARKVIIEEGLNWRFLDREPRGDISQHASNFLLKTMCLICCKLFLLLKTFSTG